MEKIKFEEVQSLLDSGKDPEEVFGWIGFNYNGFRMVELNGKGNYIKSDGKLLSDVWFDDCEDFSDGAGVVELNGKVWFINQKGELLEKNR